MSKTPGFKKYHEGPIDKRVKTKLCNRKLLVPQNYISTKT